MADTDPREQELPIIRLRDALRFFDDLPLDTKKQFADVRNADHFSRHFGYGMFLRNKLLWHANIRVLTTEVRLVLEGHKDGQRDFYLPSIETKADSEGGDVFSEHDELSLNLLDVLDLRNRGEIRIADAH